jgi:hypothetical protein
MSSVEARCLGILALTAPRGTRHVRHVLRLNSDS